MLAASVMPFRIKRHPESEPEVRFNGEGSSLTAGLMLVGRSFLATPPDFVPATPIPGYYPPPPAPGGGY